VKSPNPAFRNVDVPLLSTYMLSTKPGKEAYIEPEIAKGDYRFTVKVGSPKNADAAKAGTKLARGANFQCVMSGAPIASEYVKAEGKAGRMGARLVAVVVEGQSGRVYLPPTAEHESLAVNVVAKWKPEGDVPARLTGGTCTPYGLDEWADLFTPRQLVALASFSDLVGEAAKLASDDAADADFPATSKPLREGGTGARAYGEAIALYLAFSVSKAADRNTSLCFWESRMDRLRGTFGRQALPMIWDYAETNPIAGAGGDIQGTAISVAEVLDKIIEGPSGHSRQLDATEQEVSTGKVVSTDPPYFDNIGYADLSDFFYVWLRRMLRHVLPDLFATLTVPKDAELVATPHRHGSRENAEAFFLKGMTHAMRQIAQQVHPAFPVAIYYAFKQSETRSDTGTASTGWETFLEAVIRAGFGLCGTWPMRTEQLAGLKAAMNVLASSIVLVCRPQPANAPTATRREFVSALQSELPDAVRHLQAGNIAPVDLAQAAIGPGMAVFTRYGRVLDAEGKPMTVRNALAAINETLDTALAEQEGDFDSDSRWALTWFEQYGFNENEFGEADKLARAKNTSVDGIVDAGIARSKAGKVRLLRPNELSADWDPTTDLRLTDWEVVHHMIRALESEGETAAAEIAAKLGSKAETARELCYRLYTLSERKKRAAEALSYNALVQSWPEIMRLAKEKRAAIPVQQELV
jgi:putative DNA methylase